MFKRIKDILITTTIVLAFAVPFFSFAARTDSTWDCPNGANYCKPNVNASGSDILIFGSSKYLNFGSVSGTNGYGFRDNGGTMQFKNSAGSWTDIGTGGGGGSGTVTSIDASGGTTGLTFTGGPVTTAGTLTLSGILTVANGGTGWANIQAGGLLYGNGTGKLATTTQGTAGQVLAWLNGIPTWTATTTFSSPLVYSAGNVNCPTCITSALTSIGPTGQTSTGPAITLASSTTGTDFTITGSGAVMTFNLPSASASNRGLLTSADYTTFTNKLSTAVTSIGPAGQTQTGPAITLATSSTPFNGLTSSTTITATTNTVTFANTLAGILTPGGGGTGWSSLQANTVLLGNGSGSIATTSAGTNGFVLALVGGIPTWTATTTLANISGTLVETKGGTNQTTYTTGDILYASAGNTLSKLGIGTGGFVLGVSGGIPAWVATTTLATITGTLPVSKGGTNSTSYPSNSIIVSDAAGTSLVATSTNPLYIGSIFGTTTATSTLGGGLNTQLLNVSSTTASSTFANGINLTKGCFAYLGTCISGAGGGGVSSVGLALPTGFTVTNSPVTTSGTLTGAFSSSAFGIVKIPSYIVAAAGGDFTTIQAALDACGTSGGGNIYLTDKTYAQGGTGLLFKGSNCNIYGRDATTTITFTGATTLFKTNSAAGLYSNNGIHHVVITADANVSGIAIDMSNMSHATYEDIVLDSIGTAILINDTQNITFYNKVTKISATTVKTFGINASSTNPVNGNLFDDIFIGCNANCIALQMNNANNNQFTGLRSEPSTVTGTVGIKLFDNTLTTNNGVFDNIFQNSYIEANGIGISIANAIGPGGGIQRNQIIGGIVDVNTTDLSLASNAGALNTFIGLDKNFGSPVSSFQGPFAIGSTTPFATLSVNPIAGVASAQFVVGSSTKTNLIVTNSGNIGIGTALPLALTDINVGGGSGQTTGLRLTATGAFAAAEPSVDFFNSSATFSTARLSSIPGSGFANSALLLSVANPAGTLVERARIDTNGFGIGTSTPRYPLQIASSSQPQLALSDASLTSAIWTMRNAGGTLYIGTSSPTTLATSTAGSAISVSSTASTALGVGTTSPWRTLSVTGTVGFDGLTTASGSPGTLCFNNTTKEVVFNSAVTCTVSARRYKKNIEDLNISGLSTLNQFKPSTFYYRDGNTKNFIGFIAEDMADVDNRLAVYNEDGTIQSIDTTGILTVTVKAVQELDQKVNNLQIGKIVRSVEENWQWAAISLLAVVVFRQGRKIKKLEHGQD